MFPFLRDDTSCSQGAYCGGRPHGLAAGAGPPHGHRPRLPGPVPFSRALEVHARTLGLPDCFGLAASGCGAGRSGAQHRVAPGRAPGGHGPAGPHRQGHRHRAGRRSRRRPPSGANGGGGGAAACPKLRSGQQGQMRKLLYVRPTKQYWPRFSPSNFRHRPAPCGARAAPQTRGGGACRRGC